MKMVISFLMLVIITSCGYSSTNSLKIKVQENVFVEGSRDIALLSGMHKINEENIGFDSSAGSISSVVYSFESNPDDLLEFYFLYLFLLSSKNTNLKLQFLVLNCRKFLTALQNYKEDEKKNLTTFLIL